jgi:hypothetical protein
MSNWLHRMWISPSQHEEIVDDLRAQIARLERDYVEVAQSLITETEARLHAERARNAMRQLKAGRYHSATDNIVSLSERR